MLADELHTLYVILKSELFCDEANIYLWFVSAMLSIIASRGESKVNTYDLEMFASAARRSRAMNLSMR